jgi:hypothetical protein
MVKTQNETRQQTEFQVFTSSNINRLQQGGISLLEQLA